VDIDLKIKNMTEKFAPRYKSNPFGSKIQRFEGSSAVKLTEQ